MVCQIPKANIETSGSRNCSTKEGEAIKSPYNIARERKSAMGCEKY
jgi:hypothetical protein